MDQYKKPAITEIATIAELTRGELFVDGSDDMFPAVQEFFRGFGIQILGGGS